MLVLKRELSSTTTLTVGDTTIVLKIVECRGNWVRLGFEAPPTVKILRDEVIDRDDRRNGWP